MYAALPIRKLLEYLQGFELMCQRLRESFI